MSDDAYLLGDVIDHMGDVWDIQRKRGEEDMEYEERVRKHLGFESIMELRETAQEAFIDSRKEVRRYVATVPGVGCLAIVSLFSICFVRRCCREG